MSIISACHTCGGNCLFCLYSDGCNYFRDVEPYNVAMIDGGASTVCLALCESRHAMPSCVTGSIFDNTVDCTDVGGLELHARYVLRHLSVSHVDIYVTGLTVALVAALNAAKMEGIDVTLWHYNRESGEYYRQEVM